MAELGDLFRTPTDTVGKLLEEFGAIYFHLSSFIPNEPELARLHAGEGSVGGGSQRTKNEHKIGNVLADYRREDSSASAKMMSISLLCEALDGPQHTATLGFPPVFISPFP